MGSDTNELITLIGKEVSIHAPTWGATKEGDFFTFRPHEYPKERQVYVRSRYDRGGKKFAYFPFSDMMDEHFAKGSRIVFTDFIF